MENSLTPLLLGLGIGKEVILMVEAIILALTTMVIIIVLVRKSDSR